MVRIDDGRKNIVKHDHQRPPKSPDPYAEFMASYQKDMMNGKEKQNQNQNPNSGRPTPNTNIGSANGSTGTPSVGTPLSSSSSSLSSELRISNSDIPKLRRIIKLVIEVGRLRGKCTKCGNSIQRCCEQTMLEAVSSLLQHSKL